jgi:hypothetical protein
MPHLRTHQALRVAFAFCLPLASSACWYDSTWGQAKAAQRRFAQQTTPGAIAASPDDTAGPKAIGDTAVRRTLHIRLRPNDHFLAQTVDAPRQLARVIEDANGVLSATFGAHLDVDATRPWSFDADDDLPRALDSLRRDDAGDDVDVVIGLVGALPRPTDSLHEVGYAEVLGKHIVVRAASRFGEQDIVDRQLSELSSDERDQLVRARKRHRALAVLLHELGHVLGALHEASPTSLMHPSYGPTMNAYGPGAVALMRIAIDTEDRRAVPGAQLDYLRGANTDDWAPGEREKAMANLQARGAPPVGNGDAGSPIIAPANNAPPELEAGDRERFAQAFEMFRAGAVAPAYETAKSLFTTYPKSVSVQDLRCQLATVRWLDPAEMLAECASYSKLTEMADAGK